MERTISPASNSPAGTRRSATPNPCGRSRVSNGNRLFVAADGRSKAARRWKDLYGDLMTRTGGRNEALARSAATLMLRRELLDSRLVSGEDVDVDQLLRLASELRRTCERIGLVDTADLPAEDSPPLPVDSPPWLVGRRESAEPAR